ncbi:50S ribosomal protein L4 [Patescibacteria group bacterium]|nr:50S ribosomal protein L4 [Patescibacteria group bacterium]
MKAVLYTNTGTRSGEIQLPKEIFGGEVNEVLLAQARRVFLANQRRAKAKTKTRGEVSGSGRKIWRQKGTGRARHGDKYANIFVGGGVAHGLTGKENYSLSLSRKMRRVALFSALSAKQTKKQTWFVKGLDKMEPKTKKAALLIKKMDLLDKKILLITADKAPSVYQAFRNLERVVVLPASQLNAYQVMVGGQLVFMSEAVSQLSEVFLGKKKAKKVVKKEVKKEAKKV